MKKATIARNTGALVQISKEFYAGKWQRVGFYEQRNGKITVRPIGA